MRVAGSGQSHDAAPLYYKSGRAMPWYVEVLHYLAINPLTVLVVYPSLLVWLAIVMWGALT